MWRTLIASNGSVPDAERVSDRACRLVSLCQLSDELADVSEVGSLPATGLARGPGPAGRRH